MKKWILIFLLLGSLAAAIWAILSYWPWPYQSEMVITIGVILFLWAALTTIIYFGTGGNKRSADRLVRKFYRGN